MISYQKPNPQPNLTQSNLYNWGENQQSSVVAPSDNYASYKEKTSIHLTRRELPFPTGERIKHYAPKWEFCRYQFRAK